MSEVGGGNGPDTWYRRNMTGGQRKYLDGGSLLREKKQENPKRGEESTRWRILRATLKRVATGRE